MEYNVDLATIQWLNLNTHARMHGEPLQVQHLLPRGYASYWALLPAVGIIEDFPFEQVKPNSRRIEQINRNAAIWKQYGIHSQGRTPTYQPTTFQRLAERFQLPYNLTLLQQLEWPKQGFARLEEPTMARLAQLLRHIAPGDQLNLYVEDYWRWGPESGGPLLTDEAVLYHVSVDGFMTIQRQTRFDATLYLFPSDHSWCLVNVEDVMFPIIGVDVWTEKLLSAVSAVEVVPLAVEDLVS